MSDHHHHPPPPRRRHPSAVGPFARVAPPGSRTRPVSRVPSCPVPVPGPCRAVQGRAGPSVNVQQFSGLSGGRGPRLSGMCISSAYLAAPTQSAVCDCQWPAVEQGWQEHSCARTHARTHTRTHWQSQRRRFDITSGQLSLMASYNV